MTSVTTLPHPGQNALLLPEILRNIVTWIAAEENGISIYNSDTQETTHHSRDNILYCCALVSKLWYTETIPHLWDGTTSHPWISIPSSSISHRLERIESLARRQYYANFVQRANIWTFACEDPSDKALHELDFPRLRSLKLNVPFGGYEIPQIQADGVTELEIDPQHEYYPHEWVGEDIMAEVLDRIPTLFPRLKEVSFVDYAEINQSDLQRLKERLPDVRVSPIPDQ